MTNRETFQLAAFERTLALMDKNLSIIEDVPKIMEAKNNLATSINNIQTINARGVKGLGGAYVIFNEAKTKLLETTLAVQGALIAYATGENKNDLLKNADISTTFLKQSNNESLYGNCKYLFDLALPLKAVLISDYQLPATASDLLSAALEAYKTALPDKGLAKKEATANTKARKEAFEQTTEIMTRLGNLLLMFRSTKPEFYESYLEAAHIGGYSSKKKQNQTLITGQVVDFETHAAIADAKISIVLQQSETYSGTDGNFSLAIPTPGELTIKAEKAGYTLWEDDIIIEEGEVMTVLVEMENEE
jgi:hypothetical protein